MQSLVEIKDISLVRKCQANHFQSEQIFTAAVNTQDMGMVEREFQARIERDEIEQIEGVYPGVESATLLSQTPVQGNYIAAIIVIADYQSP